MNDIFVYITGQGQMTNPRMQWIAWGAPVFVVQVSAAPQKSHVICICSASGTGGRSCVSSHLIPPTASAEKRQEMLQIKLATDQSYPPLYSLVTKCAGPGLRLLLLAALFRVTFAPARCGVLRCLS